MRLGQALTAVADKVTTEQFQDLRRHIDPEWIEQGLHATGTASARNRRLPALHVVWLIIGMALFRARAITDLVSKLNLARPGKRFTVASSAITKARKRLGAERVFANLTARYRTGQRPAGRMACTARRCRGATSQHQSNHDDVNEGFARL